jgi:hypothetical protein
MSIQASAGTSVRSLKRVISGGSSGIEDTALFLFRAIHGGPSTPSYVAGDEGIPLAEAEAAEDAA